METVQVNPQKYPKILYLFDYCKINGTRGRTRTGTAVKPEDFKSSMSTIPSRGHRREHRQNAGRVKTDFL